MFIAVAVACFMPDCGTDILIFLDLIVDCVTGACLLIGV